MKGPLWLFVGALVALNLSPESFARGRNSPERRVVRLSCWVGPNQTAPLIACLPETGPKVNGRYLPVTMDSYYMATIDENQDYAIDARVSARHLFLRIEVLDAGGSILYEDEAQGPGRVAFRNSDLPSTQRRKPKSTKASRYDGPLHVVLRCLLHRQPVPLGPCTAYGHAKLNGRVVSLIELSQRAAFEFDIGAREGVDFVATNSDTDGYVVLSLEVFDDSQNILFHDEATRFGAVRFRR